MPTKIVQGKTKIQLTCDQSFNNDDDIYTNCLNILDMSNRDNKDLYVLSIDPGIRSCGLIFEIRKSNGDVQSISAEEVSFSRRNQKGNSTLARDINLFLNQYIDYYNILDIMIIEEQETKGKGGKTNDLMFIVISYFSCMFNNTTGIKHGKQIIIEIDSRHRYSLLKAPSHLNRAGLKIWSQNTGLEMWTRYNDTFVLNIIEDLSHYDDMSDAKLQIEAFFKQLSTSTHIDSRYFFCCHNIPEVRSLV